MRVSRRDFIDYLRTGKSPIAVKLEAVVNNSLSRTHLHFDEFRTPGHADKVCPECKDWLGLTDEEVTHINRWPRHLKEHIRHSIVVAIEDGRPAEFFWQLTRQLTEDAYTLEKDGHLVIHMASPISLVKSEGEEVEVGETE